MELKQKFAILNEKKKTIRAMCPMIVSKSSGIYLFYRLTKEKQWCYYVGQAKDLLQRTAQHLMGKKQHIDKSIQKHGLCVGFNAFGWRLKVLKFCKEAELDYWEQYYIKKYSSYPNSQMYNVAGGGQIDKAEDIGERFEVKLKSYRNGKAIAHDKARQYVKTMFDKYLDYVIKGKPNKIKERKLKEFEEFLGGTE